MNRIGKNIKKARSEKGYTQEQSADQTWRKEILKRVIWLVIAGLIIMISASLIQYGGEIAKDTLQVPMWSPWLNSAAYPIAYMIIGSQIMALVLQACGKRNSEYRWIKAVFLILVAAILIWIMAATVSISSSN